MNEKRKGETLLGRRKGQGLGLSEEGRKPGIPTSIDVKLKSIPGFLHQRS